MQRVSALRCTSLQAVCSLRKAQACSAIRISLVLQNVFSCYRMCSRITPIQLSLAPCPAPRRMKSPRPAHSMSPRWLQRIPTRRGPLKWLRTFCMITMKRCFSYTRIHALIRTHALTLTHAHTCTRIGVIKSVPRLDPQQEYACTRHDAIVLFWCDAYSQASTRKVESFQLITLDLFCPCLPQASLSSGQKTEPELADDEEESDYSKLDEEETQNSPVSYWHSPTALYLTTYTIVHPDEWGCTSINVHTHDAKECTSLQHLMTVW